MTKPVLLTVNLPFFPGFYESDLSAAVDYAEERYAENVAEESDHETDEAHFPEPLRLDASDLGGIFFDVTDYGAAYQQIARDYVEAFDFVAGEAFGFSVADTRQRYNSETRDFAPEDYQRPSIRATFESMDSPREYNFTTDRVYAQIPLNMMLVLFRKSKAENHATLKALIAERFTSRDGFISSYPNRLPAWLEKPVRDWDHNELGTLLSAALRMVDIDPESDEFRDEMQSALGDEYADRAWESAVDWPRYETKRMEKRAEKLAQWLESDCDMVKAWRYEHRAEFDAIVAVEPSLFADLIELDALPYRCPETLDLFRDGAA